MLNFSLAPRSARLLSATALLLSLGACSLQPRLSDEERLAAWLPADVLLLAGQNGVEKLLRPGDATKLS